MYIAHRSALFFFFFNDTATTEIYTLSLHDALPISAISIAGARTSARVIVPNSASMIMSPPGVPGVTAASGPCSGGYLMRSEEHTSELQSRLHLVCRLLLEKKNIRVERVGSTSTSTP